MSLSHVLCLAFVARAYAWARISVTFASAEVGRNSLTDHLKSLQDTSPALGKLQLLGACCDQHIGRAVDVQTSINSNALYGSTAEIAKTVFKSSDCTPVTKADWDGKAEADCSYVAIFSNTEFADNEYAANCVPAQVCKDDVVGMTKGLIATYGVALQIMQQNLGSLVHLSEGPILKCYEGQNQINSGDLQPLLHDKEIKLKPLGVVIGSETVMEISGMKKLGALESLSRCKNDPSIGYLYVHKNKYWSTDKQAVDLAAFTSIEDDKHEGEEKARKAALEKAEEAAAKGDNKAAEVALEKTKAVVPKRLTLKLGSTNAKSNNASAEAEFDATFAAPQWVDKDTKVQSAVIKGSKDNKPAALEETDAAGAKEPAKLTSALNVKLEHPKGKRPVVLGKKFHSNWNLPSISPVFCPCGKRCAKGRTLGLWNYWCFRYECKKCPLKVEALLGH